MTLAVNTFQLRTFTNQTKHIRKLNLMDFTSVIWGQKSLK